MNQQWKQNCQTKISQAWSIYIAEWGCTKMTES